MIKIQLPQLIPTILRSQGVKETNNNCGDYNNDNALYDAGTKKFVFDRTIYGGVEVKESLKQAQYKKCCYCESFLGATSYGAVEHYRPKGAVLPGKKQKKIYPGYYWLAYEWKNLLFVCQRCNTNKGPYFPLEDNSQQARNHTQSLVNESPLFIHPVVDDPSQHINFYDDAIIGETVKGKTTIEYLQLDRTDLFESRRKVFDIFKHVVVSARRFYKDENNQDVYNEALTLVQKYLSISSEYSAMTNVYFKQYSDLPEFAGIQN